jgi:alpha-1,3-glucosyltransferase
MSDTLKQSQSSAAHDHDDSQQSHALKYTSTWQLLDFLGVILSPSEADILLLSTAFKFLLFPA